MSQALIVCAHGTHDPRGQRVVDDLVTQVSVARPDLVVRAAYVDVQEPSLPDAVNNLAAQHDSVIIVPLLLSSGFHTEVDVAQAAALHENVRSAPALGPHPLLAEVLVDRLIAAGAVAGDDVVLAVAGSTRESGARDAQQMLDLLSERWVGQVRLGYLAAREPHVKDAVAAPRSAQRIALSSFLIGPGFFHDQLLGCGADVVAEPLGADPRLAQIVLEHFALQAA